jgi:hypothetical protein
VSRIFRIDQRQIQQLFIRRASGHKGRIDGGTGYARQRALPGYWQGIKQAYPRSAVPYRPIPDFFLSQSSSIFNRPISE